MLGERLSGSSCRRSVFGDRPAGVWAGKATAAPRITRMLWITRIKKGFWAFNFLESFSVFGFPSFDSIRADPCNPWCSFCFTGIEYAA
jgi:hypothetical protein